MTHDDVRVLVTGGTGLLGRALREVQTSEGWSGEWTYVGTADADLTDRDQTAALFDRVRPTHVVHLAAKVGGLFANQEDNTGFLLDNVLINAHVMRACREHDVSKVVACLSTCVFPDGASLPLDHRALHAGPPHPSNEGYSHAKRLLETMCRLQSRELGRPYVCVIPTNMYGPHDNFDLHNAHVLPALIHRAYLAKQHGQALRVRGTGRPLRQFLFARDAARLIGHVLQAHDGPEPVVLTVPERDEVSVEDVAHLVADNFGVDVVLDYDPTADGQYRKTTSAKDVFRLVPDFRFTPLDQGIAETCRWFEAHVE